MEKLWTKGLLGFLAIAASFGIVAFLSGSLPATLLVIFPILFVGIMFISDEEGRVDVEIDMPKKVKVDDIVEVKARIILNRGAGIFLFELPYFEHFKPVDGSNVRVVFKGLRSRVYDLTYKIQAARRGKFSFSEIKYTYNPTMGILNTKTGKINVNVYIDVIPKVEILRKRGLRIRASLLNPRSARSRIGPASTDFDTIRSYVPGDPYRTINWKATARRTTSNAPLVNQYEREGLHTIMFALDRGHTMRQGTKEDNPLESSIKLILSFASLLLNYQHNVGFWVMQKDKNARKSIVVPGSGMEQYIRLRRSALLVEPIKQILSSYNKDREFFAIARETVPTTFLFTSITETNADTLSLICRQIRGVSSRLIVIDVLPYGIYGKMSPYSISSIYNESYNSKARRKLYSRFSGFSKIIPWDPEITGYGKIISRLTGTLR